MTKIDMKQILPSAKDTDDTTNLIVTPNHGIDLSFLGKCGKVDGILAERVETLLCRTTFDSPIATDVFDCRDDRGLCEASLLQHRGHRGCFDQRSEDVVLRDIGVVHRLLQTLRIT